MQQIDAQLSRASRQGPLFPGLKTISASLEHGGMTPLYVGQAHRPVGAIGEQMPLDRAA